MNLGSTAELNEKNVNQFIPIIQKEACIVTCEISQVPLSGVIRILEAAKSSDCLTILDVDVSPSVAVNEAKLGTTEELLKAISLANVVKPAGECKPLYPYVINRHYSLVLRERIQFMLL